MWKCERCNRSLSYAFVVELRGEPLRRFCTPTCAYSSALARGRREGSALVARGIGAQASASAGTGARPMPEPAEPGD